MHPCTLVGGVLYIMHKKYNFVHSRVMRACIIMHVVWGEV